MRRPARGPLFFYSRRSKRPTKINNSNYYCFHSNNCSLDGLLGSILPLAALERLHQLLLLLLLLLEVVALHYHRTN